MAASEGTSITLGDEQREVARARILRAACEVLQRQGFRSTVDDVATAAGVSRRTVFRYFPTQGQLLASAVRTLLERFGAEMPAAPTPDEDVHDWLLATARRLHRLHAELVGEMFWDFYADRPEIGPELADVVSSLIDTRSTWGAQLTRHAWKAMGQAGPPPTWVTEALTLLLSGFAYEGLSVREGASPEHTAEVAAEMAMAVLERAARVASSK